MSVVDFPTPSTDWLKKYYERGFRLVFFDKGHKGPEGTEGVGWKTRSDTLQDYRAGRNVGIFTGHEISPGKYLADIDFDWAEGIPLAKRTLPPTGYGFGRDSRPISHCFYTTPTPLPHTVFKNIDGKPLVELRGTEKDGAVGIQTMAPPSIHPNGEQIILKMDGDIGHSEDLLRRTTLYAIACLLFSSLGHRGLIHDTRLAVAGFLLSEGLTPEEAIMVGESIAAASGNNVEDVKVVVRSTVTKIKANEHVGGRGALAKALGDDGKKIIVRIKEWLGAKDFIEDGKGKILSNNQENVKRALEKSNIVLSYDVFSEKPMIQDPNFDVNGYDGPLIDTVVTRAWLQTDERYHFRPPKDFFYDVVMDVAARNRYHPVLDYLKDLVWDGVPRVNTWIIHSAQAADTEYVQAVSSIMLIAAVRRVTQPGAKYDEMVVLESGEQGLMKSSALRMLCPNEKWFSDDLPLNVDAKQIVERTAGKWIIEASDLSGMHASQVEHLKGMLSRQVDGPVRLAYGRLPVEQPRQFIIVGTTNSYSYLSDSTGNRRFWPIRVQKFNVQWIKENRDQMWAEAYARERAGESIRLDPSLYAHATLQQERRRAEDPWETKFEEIFQRNKKWRITMDEVWAPIGIPIDRRDSKSTDRILKAMHRLGFKRMSVRSEHGLVVRGFGRDVQEGQLIIDHDD